MSGLSLPLHVSHPPYVFGGEGQAELEPDAELMLRVREGDDTSFSILLERYRGWVVRSLYPMTQNYAISEELAQEVFLRIYRNRGTYEPTAKFKTWMFRITTNLALNWLRASRREKRQASLNDQNRDGTERQVADARLTAEQALVHEVRLREIRQAIESLPPKQRAAVLMHKYEGLGYDQIGKVLGCSTSAVKSLMFRAYESLRNQLVTMA
jgi:RNA polymerase sigma-70 factor (ECF subfamily)